MILSVPAQQTMAGCMTAYEARTNHVLNINDQTSGLSCANCTQRVAGTTENKLGNLPTTLIISLLHPTHAGTPILNRRLVQFEEQGLQVTDSFGTAATYDLFAVVNHLGNTVQSGHCKCLSILVEESS